MSRITGSDAQGMMEAYAAIYAPQELTEEQIWEEVENWVNSLVEEGYDLSEYTWEEMYEAYIEEQSKEANMATWAKANPKLAAAAAERERTRGTSATTNPLLKDLKSKLPEPKPAPTATASKPAPTATASKPPAAAPAASKPPAAAPAASKPPAAAPAASKPPMTAFQAGGGEAALRTSAQKRNVRGGGTAMVPTKSKASIEATGRENLYRAGGGDEAIRKSAKPRNVRGGGQVRVPTLTRQDVINKGSIAASLKQSYEYEPYDLVLEYLLSEGHVETVDEALYVMMEMDSETIQSICKR